MVLLAWKKQKQTVHLIQFFSVIFTELDINQDGFLSHLELETKTEDETN